MKKQLNQFRTILAPTILLVIFVFPSLSAQNNESRIFSYIGVSSTNFPDNFSGNWSNGTSLGFGFDLSINKRVSFLPYIEFSYFPLNENHVKKNLVVNNGNVRIVGGTLKKFNISGDIKYKILTSKMITPYFIAGIGYFIMGTDDSPRAINDVGNDIKRFDVNTEYAFSSNFGAGFDVDINSKFGVFLDVRYFIGFTEDISTSIPFRMGITYKL